MSQLTVQKLIEEGKPIYVRNCTGRLLEKISPYVLVIKDAHGKAWPVPIPATKYPFLISDIPPEVLANSMELRTAIARNILEIVDPDEAEEILSDPMVRKSVTKAARRFQPQGHRDRLRKKKQQINNEKSEYAERYLPPYVQSSTDFSDNNINPNNTELRVAEEREADEAERQVGQASTPKVESLVRDANNNPENEEDVLLDLIGMDLKDDDYGFIIHNAKSSNLVSWAKAELAERASASSRKKRKSKAKHTK